MKANKSGFKQHKRGEKENNFTWNILFKKSNKVANA